MLVESLLEHSELEIGVIKKAAIECARDERVRICVGRASVVPLLHS